MLAGFRIWERDLVGEQVQRMPNFWDRLLEGRGPSLGIFWEGSHWGQQDTAKEQCSLDHGGSAEQPCWKEAGLRVGSGERLGRERLQDWSELGNASALRNFSYPKHTSHPYGLWEVLTLLRKKQTIGTRKSKHLCFDIFMAGMTVLIFWLYPTFLFTLAKITRTRMLIASKTVKNIACANIYSCLFSPDSVLLTFVLCWQIQGLVRFWPC